MHDSFWFGVDLGVFIFPGFNVTSIKGLIAVCIGLASLAVLYEVMKILQVRLHIMTINSAKTSEGHNSEHSSLLSRMSRRNVESSTRRTYSYWLKWTLEITHWTFHTMLSYLLMLAVMTFNGYIGIALIIGSGLGYWIFGPVVMQLNATQYHDKIQVNKYEPECTEATTSSGRRASTVSVIAEELVVEVNVDVN